MNYAIIMQISTATVYTQYEISYRSHTLASTNYTYILYAIHYIQTMVRTNVVTTAS